jgi:hypothetical protein
MALLKFDRKNLRLDLVVGIKEEYKPTQEIINVNDKIEELKKDIEMFVKKTWGEKTQEELFDMFKNNKEDQQLWVEYMKTQYGPSVDNIANNVVEINKVICPGFKEKLEK